MARPKTSEVIKRKALRARGRGESMKAIARRYGVSKNSILRWAVAAGQEFVRTPKIIDEFTGLTISRQRKKQLRWKKNGRRLTCGEPAVTNHHCPRDAAKDRER